MRLRTSAALAAVAVSLAACSSGGGSDDYAAEADAYWGSLNTEEQSAFCIGMDLFGGGFRLIAEGSDGDGAIDLLAGGRHDDTHDNRVAIGAALDEVAADRCPDSP